MGDITLGLLENGRSFSGILRDGESFEEAHAIWADRRRR